MTALAGKVLFGSDAPNTGLTVTQLLDGLRAAGLPAAAWAALTGGTARRLVGEVRMAWFWARLRSDGPQNSPAPRVTVVAASLPRPWPPPCAPASEAAWCAA